MKCDEVQPMLTEYLDGTLDEKSRNEISSHMENCMECSKEFSGLKAISETILSYKAENPNESLRKNFDAMLQTEIENISRTNHIKETPLHKIISIKWSSPLLKIAAGISLLVCGIWIGVLLKGGEENIRSGQLSELKNEMKDMKELLIFTMLNGESASQRIRAVNYSAEISEPNQKIILALIGTMNNDKNINVRLAAVYSLSKFWESTQVRDSLIASLSGQTEPIIQIVMINILTDKKETKAIGPMQEIISNKNTMKEVKDIAEKSIRVLM